MSARGLAKVLKGVGHVGSLIPGIAPGIRAMAPATVLLEHLSTGYVVRPPDQGKREVYRAGLYRVVMWLERGFATPPHIYVAVERNGYFGVHAPNAKPPAAEAWQHVRTWTDVQAAPAVWWKPWRRKHELFMVIDAAITFVDRQDSAEITAQATLEAVAETLRPS